MKTEHEKFLAVLEAFNNGYKRVGWARHWAKGVLRWSYEMGRRQSKGARP